MGTVTGLPPSATLRKKLKITHDGVTEDGPLVVDEKGFAVDVRGKAKYVSLTKKLTPVQRHYICFWRNIRTWTVDPAPPQTLVGSTINASSVILTVTCVTTGTHSWTLTGTSVPIMRNEIGKFAPRR